MIAYGSNFMLTAVGARKGTGGGVVATVRLEANASRDNGAAVKVHLDPQGKARVQLTAWRASRWKLRVMGI